MYDFLCRLSVSRSARAVFRARLVLLIVLITVLLCSGLAPVLAQTATPVNVLTWRFDITHAGANTNETALNAQNVNTSTFGKLFSLKVDGSVYAQPLYMSGLTMGDGLVHNVLFVATEHDSVYAFDADSNGGTNANPLWHVTLLDAAHGAGAGATTVPYTDNGSPDVAPEVGITSTPTIDPTTNTIYVVSTSKESGSYFMRLHALNILTGAEQAGSPVAITATVPGTGNGSSGGQLSFSPLWQNQRTALALYGGHVFIAFGAHGDNGPWHGWVFSYDATALTQTAVVCLSANGFGNGVWQSGSGLPIDTTTGKMYLATGNGSYAPYPPFNSSSEFGDSIVAFNISNGQLTPVDAFTPFNQAHLSSADLDQGAGGILMFPDQQGANPHILLQVGKEGRILVLNRDNLGGYATGVSSNTNALQDILNQTGGLWSTPAYWNGNVYIWASKDVPKLFQINSGVLDTTPSSVSTISSAFPGASFTVSSNGTQNGVAWAVRTDQFTTHGAQVLYAWDANDLSTPIYESDTNAARDGGGNAMKFAIPVVTNGKVYVAANGEIDIYGLFSGTPTAAAPVISPNGGSFGGTLNVTLTSATSSANIYYTLDGSVPTPASTLYTGPIAINTSVTIRAIANGTGFLQSAVSSASFTSLGQTPPVSVSPGGGTYTTTQQVTLSDTDTSAVIYYTTDGSTPTASSTPYAGPITVSSSMTINAVAIDPVLQSSTVTTAAYVIQPGSTTINFGSGFSSVAGLTLNGSATNVDDERLQLTTGGTYQAGSVFWNQPIGIQNFTTDFEFQLSLAQGDGFTFTIQNVGPTALGASGSGLGYQNIGKSVAIKFDLYSNAGEGTDSTGVYTNGASPTVPAVDMTSSGVILRSGDSMLAHITYDGTTLTMTLLDLVTNKTFVLTQAINIPQIVGGNTAYVGFTGSTGGLTASQKILYWTYATQATTTPTTTAPVFSPAAGTYSTPPSVTLSSATQGATIYYTTNGTAPTTSSFVYTSPIVPGTGTTTIEAMAVASGALPSGVVTATYVVTAPVTATPSFSPAAGTYSSAQNVTLSDSTSGAVIYYTTNGATPTTSSAVYSAAIPVASTMTIKAIAVASGMQASGVASAAYTIQTTGNTVNFPSGFSSSAGLSLNGTAMVTNQLLQLTSASATSYTNGGAWFTTPVNITSFVTDFDFQLLNAKADGFTFAIQNVGLSALGPMGSGLGYGASQPGGGGGIAKSVAVKFDLYNNDGEGTDSTGVYTNGASPTVPATDMTASGVKLNSGHVLHAHITYDGTNLTLLLTDTVTSASFTGTFAVNIPGAVGGNTAYVGFTGGTGGLAVTTDILDWTMSTSTVTTPVTATPGFSPAAGTYNSSQNVTLNDSTSGAVIYYTTDGTTPTTSSAVYSSAISVASTTTIKAIAVASGMQASAVATAVYTIQTTGNTVNFPSGFSSSAGLSLTGTAIVTNQLLQLTSAPATYTKGAAWFTTPVNITSFVTDFDFQLLSAKADGFTFAIQNVGASATGPSGSGLGYGASQPGGGGGIAKSVAVKFDLYSNDGEGTDSTGVYTNGASPTVPATDMTASGVKLNSGHVLHAHITYDGTNLTLLLTDAATSASFTGTFAVNIPAAVGGNTAYVGFTGGTGGLSVTTDILDWTMSSTANLAAIKPVLTKPIIPVTTPVAMKGNLGSPSPEPAAEGVAATMRNATVSAAAIEPATAGPVAPVTLSAGAKGNSAGEWIGPDGEVAAKPAEAAGEPKFSPAPGLFTGDTQVSLRCDTPGCVIHYTFDGSQPLAGSAVYGAPISVKGTELTIKAYASAPGKKDSPVVTGIYRIRE